MFHWYLSGWGGRVPLIIVRVWRQRFPWYLLVKVWRQSSFNTCQGVEVEFHWYLSDCEERDPLILVRVWRQSFLDTFLSRCGGRVPLILVRVWRQSSLDTCQGVEAEFHWYLSGYGGRVSLILVRVWRQSSLHTCQGVEAKFPSYLSGHGSRLHYGDVRFRRSFHVNLGVNVSINRGNTRPPQTLRRTNPWCLMKASEREFIACMDDTVKCKICEFKLILDELSFNAKSFRKLNSLSKTLLQQNMSLEECKCEKYYRHKHMNILSFHSYDRECFQQWKCKCERV